jgi:hypothetical protein
MDLGSSQKREDTSHAVPEQDWMSWHTRDNKFDQHISKILERGLKIFQRCVPVAR